MSPEAAVQAAQKGLRLQYLSGEQLRPEDAVVAPPPPAAQAARSQRRQHRSAKMQPTDTSPTRGRGRRKGKRG